MSTMLNGKTYIVPLVILGLGAMTVATAQTSNSPFANKAKKKAWEVAEPVVSTSQYPAARTSPPQTAPSSYSGPLNSGGYNYTAPTVQQQPDFSQAQDYDYAPQPGTYNTPTSQDYSNPSLAGGSTSSGAYYPGRSQAPAAPITQNYNQQPASQYGGQYNYQYRGHNPQQYGNPVPRSAQMQTPYRKGSWSDRLGLKNWKTALSGALRLGGAATHRDGTSNDDWNADFIGDGRVDFEVSTITSGGLEYGINLEARAQYDKYRRGFGGLAGDCNPSIAGCTSVIINGTPTALRGHTSQFYSFGPDNAKEFEYTVEGAYLFLRSSYGDITLGRDDGAAYLFSLGAPTLLAVNGSNSPVDYTGLDSVKTVNDASGFSEKITYTSPRLLGDQIGVGVQLGASYAPNARACGVDYCVRRNGADGSGALSPDLKDVMEVGLSLDRKFGNGLEVEATGTYARASEDSGIAAFDDLSVYNAGIEIKLSDWTVGGSYLQSNNGLADGDYTAWDAGITWKPSKFGVMASYGHAKDDNIDLTSDQAVVGVSYEFDRFTLGTGVQYIERTVPLATGGVVGREKEKATALFVEGGFTF